VAGLAACGGDDGEPTPAHTAVPPGSLALSSVAVKDGERIPVEYTCDGADRSPALEWTGSPAGTKAFALLMVDPDAPRKGGYVHWVVFNIPGTATSLAASASPNGVLPGGSGEGNNSAGKPGYTGPCPPAGKEHHYVFRLFALDASLGLKAGATGDELLNALDAVKVLGESTLAATYMRR